MTVLPKRKMRVLLFSMVALLAYVSWVSGAGEGGEATTPDGVLKVTYGASWSIVGTGSRGFALVTDAGDILKVEQLPIGESTIEEIVSGQEEDLRELGATVKRKPFKSRGARGYQLEGEFDYERQRLHALQTVVAGKGKAYLLLIVSLPDRFRIIEPEIRAILNSVVVGDVPPLPELPRAAQLPQGTEEAPEPRDAVGPVEVPKPSPEKVEEPEPSQIPGEQPSVEEGVRKRGTLGVKITSLKPEIAEFLKVPGSKGVLVVEVLQDGPADKAGIQPQDAITTYDGRSVGSPMELAGLVVNTEPGRRVEIITIRNWKKRVALVEIAEAPAQEPPSPPELAEPTQEGRGWLGTIIAPLTPDRAGNLGIPDAKGVLVVDVAAGSPAGKAGIRSGDVVISYNENPVETPQKLARLAGEGKPGERVTLKVIRKTKPLVIGVVLGVYPVDADDVVTRRVMEGRWGLTLRGLDEQAAKRLNIRYKAGLYVETVAHGSAADKAGLVAGDIILKVDDKDMRSLAEFKTAAEKKNMLRLSIRRGRMPKAILLRRNRAE